MSGPTSSVITGGAAGIGRVIAEHLTGLGQHVVVLEPTAAQNPTPTPAPGQPPAPSPTPADATSAAAAARIHSLQADAADPDAAVAAADLAEGYAPLTGG